ncbi:hypothetical protein DEU32_110127 [Curtobacterium sp. AG1037]|nr:hypothetical protein DEU32_110127 [Curtobacterium sp. AG1037]
MDSTQALTDFFVSASRDVSLQYGVIHLPATAARFATVVAASVARRARNSSMNGPSFCDRSD